MAQDDKREIVQLLLTLLSIPSPSGEEMPLLKWIESYLYNCNFNIHWQKVTDNRANLCAYRGYPQYLIATHVDTVPVWGHPYAFSPKIEGDKIWARGAIDTKGQLAALLKTIKETKASCAIALFVDEEKEALGSEKYIPPFSFKGAVVLEPTNLCLALAEAGNIELYLKIKGKTAHGALSGRGKNAIEIFCDFYQRLKSLSNLQYSHCLFKNCGLNIGKIKGGIDCQLVAENCEAEIDIPVLPGKDVEKVWQEIKDLLNEFPLSWELKSFDAPWEISPQEEVVKRMVKCIETEMFVSFSGMNAWTDAANLFKKGIPSVVFGVGDLALAHTPEEHVNVREVLKLSRILKRFLEI